MAGRFAAILVAFLVLGNDCLWPNAEVIIVPINVGGRTDLRRLALLPNSPLPMW